MKHKYTVITLAIFCLITILLNITVYASIGSNAPSSKIDLFTTRSTASKTKTIIQNDTKLTLTYEKTRNVSFDEYRDIYTIKSSEYHFDKHGKLCGFISGEINNLATDVMVSENQAKAIAIDHISNTYGNIFADFPFYSCVYREETNDYSIYYKKCYGKDNSITALYYHIRIKSDGTIIYSLAPDTADFESSKDFNIESINTLTKEKLQQYALEQITSSLNVSNIETIEYEDDMYLHKGADGNLYVKICALITNKIENNSNSTIKPNSIYQVYYYEIN